MSAVQRAFPFLVAATAGVISGVYIFKPLLAEETRDLNNPPGHQNVTASDRPSKGQNNVTEDDSR